MKTVMLIDDEPSMHVLIEELLSSHGYAYRGVRSGKDGITAVAQDPPDLLLLDVMLPDVNGFEVCETIRRTNKRLPIIFLSAKGDIVDKSVGFKAGGDDYVTKPFNSTELLLRIQAALRRSDEAGTAPAAPERFVLGDFELRFAEHEAYVRGERVNLTAKEFDILAMLAAEPGTVFTRKQIYEKVWGEAAYSGANNVTVFIRRIREKIEDNPSEPKYLLTAHGVGYEIPEQLIQDNA